MDLSEINNGYVLDSVFEIEELLEEISTLNSKSQYYQDLKKHRAKVLEEKIQNIESKVKLYRNVIFDTMKKHTPDLKTVDFPEIGKVTRKKFSDFWSINDEEELISFLDSNGLKESVVEVKEKIIKKSLDSVLNDIYKKKKQIPGVSLIKGEEDISISFDKKHKPKNQEKSYENVNENFDNMEI